MQTLKQENPLGKIRKKVAFAFLMGFITTFIISLTIVSYNIGFNDLFFKVWIRSWVMGYIIVIPTILFIAPPVQKVIDRLFD
ncbi:DUF2798 domain-containing protein [Flammeovirga sp. EKP202]|uniref:DUF2798 domain-containing protein n=1 Tax=Flammeovirga sp. EKP202 TaxID=2770592 RepID=UPI00165FE9AC|nr:DUF2798 domain-containing protein [Flammeovirga sp. EKP202]MBD0404056.1 DUF2798 domain-containing protein [Flammeovirga sp. EKP202]